MVSAMTAKALGLPKDGWLTNAEADDERSREVIRVEYGAFEVGPPRPTDKYSLDELVEKNVVGIYLKVTA